MVFLRIILFICLVYLHSLVSCSDLSAKIYYTINKNNYQPCVQLANATHQIGCTSDMKGNHGIVHLVNFQEDLDWLITEGPYNPYIPLIDAPMFTVATMKRLMDSKKVSGALVILENSSMSSFPKHPFSPDPTCPLDDFGFYKGNPEYGNCKKVSWNMAGNGMAFEYYGIPIFGLSDSVEIERIKQCAIEYNFNGTAKSYPLCSAELKDFMFAAKDTPTCKRKSELANPIMSTYCDPLGDNNVFGTLYPMVEELAPNSVIMISTRLDSTGFFHDLAPGADNGVTGIVTLLAVARALGDYKRTMQQNDTTEDLKPIMFTFFNGEVWDYIGSSRMVWDMENDKFPYPEERKDTFNGTIDDSVYVSKVNLSHIGYFVELSQLGLDSNGGFYAHSDPISQKTKTVKDGVGKMMKYLTDSAKISETFFKEVDRELKFPLPPASFQRFLRKRKDIPGLVLADHEREFVNKFYNSRFDTDKNLGIDINSTVTDDYKKLHGSLAENLTKISETIANSLYLLASNGQNPKEKIVVPKNLTANLLYCLLYSANCSAFYEIRDTKSSGQFIDGQTYPRYITIAGEDNHITHIIYRLLSFYLGEWLDNCPGKSQRKLPKALSYINVTGDGSQNSSFVCVKATTYMTEAVSPAFELKDFTSTEYSTWTESMWSPEMGIRIYLIADPKIEGVVLASGIIMFICSFALTFFFRQKASVLFTPTLTPVVAITS